METMKGEEISKNGSSSDKNATVSRLKEFCAYTTAHGLGRLVEARNPFWRLFWVAACISAMAMFISQVYSLEKIYSRKPIQTRIDYQHEFELDFPEVTLCNLNILRKSRIKAIPNLQKLMFGFDNFEEANITKPKGKRAKKKKWDEAIQTILGEEIRKTLAKIPAEKLYHFGHRFNDMIVFCKYRGANCKSKWFTEKIWRNYWDPKYGNCYQFNSGRTAEGKPIKPRTSTKAGATYGLHFMLNVEQHEYFGEATPEAGIRVHIGSLGKMPFPYEHGITVSPGFSTQISLTQTTVKRIDPFLNNSCLAEGESSAENIYQMKYGILKYSETSCKMSCYASLQVSECGCMESKFPIPNGTRVCNHRNQTEDRCLDKLFKKYKRGKLGCSKHCPPPCRDNSFQPTIAMGYWPSENLEDKIIDLVKQQRRVSSVDINHVRRNYLILNIYFKEINYMLIEQSLAYGIESFLSDIGGNMGMWVGISLLTCAELIELALVAFHHFLKTIGRPRGSADLPPSANGNI